MKGNIVTHNHPSGVPLPSTPDIRVAGANGAKEIRMATVHGTGSLKAVSRGGTVANWSGLARDYGKMLGSGKDVMKAYNWLVKNAKNYGLSFKIEGKR